MLAGVCLAGCEVVVGGSCVCLSGSSCHIVPQMLVSGKVAGFRRFSIRHASSEPSVGSGCNLMERWQTRYLPAYGAWAIIVVAAFPPVFGFS